MLNNLLQILIAIWWDLMPVFVVKAYEGGVVLRRGMFQREVGPGWHLKIPFLDQPLLTIVVTTTIRGNAQSLTTDDGVDICTSGIVKYRIADVRVFLLEVTDATDALYDVLLAETKKIVVSHGWDQCRGAQADRWLTQRVRRESAKWGVAVEQATLVTVAKMPSLRLIGMSDERI